MCCRVDSEADYVVMGDGIWRALFVKGVLSFLVPGHKLGEDTETQINNNERARTLAQKLNLSNSKQNG